MKSKFLTQATAVALGVTLLMVGCKPGDRTSVAAASSRRPDKAQVKGAEQSAALGVSAIRARKGALAVAFTERAVYAMPQNAAYRAQLGQSYLLAGRFASSIASFRDALVLAPNDGQAMLGLALAQAALDRGDDARRTIADAGGKVADTDRGLALALAGDAPAAIALLEPAARVAGATPKTRQNLALAYALAGRWDMARATAAQDVAPAELDVRMAQWATFAGPRSRPAIVASFLGVTGVADPGMPTELALAPTAADTRLASAAVLAEPVAAPAMQTVALAASEPANAFVAPAPEVAMIEPDPAPMRVAVTERTVAPAPMLMRAGYTRPSRDTWAVQLGAFSTARGSEAAWNKVRRRVHPVSRMVPLASVFRTAGGTFHRLSVGGIGTRMEAARLCDAVRKSSGTCFVRRVTDEAPPIQWAALRRPERLASR